MARLEDLQPNATVNGILPGCQVTVVGAQWFGSDALELTYKDPDGRVANTLLYRDDAVSYTHLDVYKRQVLLIASRLDSTVGVKNAPRILAALGSADKELFWVERSDHMVTLDYDKELVFQRAADFIREKAST